MTVEVHVFVDSEMMRLYRAGPVPPMPMPMP